MNLFALLLLSLHVFTAGADPGGVKIIKLGKLTIECFSPDCEQKLKEVDAYIADSGIDGLGNIVTIAFTNWWSKPTVEGRAIINMYDSPQVIVSFLERHGAAARNALYDAREYIKEVRTKYDVDVTCERRTLAVRCMEVAKQIRDALDLFAHHGLKPIPQSIEIVAIDWNVDKSTPKAAVFGTLRSDSRRWQIKDVLTLHDIQQGLVSNKVFIEP